MATENLKELSDQMLRERIKKLKTNKIINASIIGFTIGIVVYSAVKKGFGFPTFFPLLLALFLIRNSRKDLTLEKEIQNELTARNLK